MNGNKQLNLLVLSQCQPALPHRQCLGAQLTVVSKTVDIFSDYLIKR